MSRAIAADPGIRHQADTGAGLVLEALDVSYSIGGATLVDRASLALAGGEVVGLLGANGAGKSTFLKLVSGELVPASGAIKLHGRDVHGLKPRELADERAVVAQSSELSFSFTAREVVLLGATVPGFDIKMPALDAACSQAMRHVDIEHLAERSYPSLSGGERQRVQIARALCQLHSAERRSEKAPVLLLDEPTSSLDIAHQRMVLDVVRARAVSGTAVLAVLHDVNLAAAYCDRLIMMRKGRIIASGTPKEVITSAVLSEAYGCTIKANALPESGTPFALPIC